MTLNEVRKCYINGYPFIVIDGDHKWEIGKLRYLNSYSDPLLNIVGLQVKYGEIIDVSPDQIISGEWMMKTCKNRNINVRDEDGEYKSAKVLSDEITKRGDDVMKNLNDMTKCVIDCANVKGVSVNRNIPGISISEHCRRLFAEISDVNIIVPNKVVEVTFSDGLKEKAVCKEPDIFSLEQAIAICIGKKFLGGTSGFNNAVRKGVKVYENKLKKEIADLEEKERIARKKKKKLEYQLRRAERLADLESKENELEKERQIEIQKEAYIRAMEYMKNKNA